METYLNAKYPSTKLTTDKIYFNFKTNGYTTTILDKDNKVFTELSYSWKSNSLRDIRNSEALGNQLKGEIEQLVNRPYLDFYIKDVNVISVSNDNQNFTKESLLLCIYTENKESGSNIENEQLIDVVKGVLDYLKDKNLVKEILVIYNDKDGNPKKTRELKLVKEQFTLSKQEMIKLIRLGP